MSPRELLDTAIQLHETGRLAEAEDFYRQVTAVDPASAVAHNNLGNLLRNQERLHEAVESYHHALQLAPWVPEIHNNLGVSLRDLRKREAAVQSFRNALALRPDYAEALNNLGNVLKDLGELDEAVRCYRRAIELDPGNTMALDNLGLSCVDLGLLEEADEYFRRSFAANPRSPHVRWSRAHLMLLRGDLEGGWPEAEWRWKCPEWQRYLRTIGCHRDGVGGSSQPVWDGTPLTGRTILVQAEQGLGDTLQFVRYLPLVKQLGGRVCFECPRSLLPLLAKIGADELIGEGSAIPPFDVRVALLSLPAIFRTTLETIPASVPYLHADPALVAFWQRRLEECCPRTVEGRPTFRVGVNWRGRPGQGIYRMRDFPLDALKPLSGLPGVRLISLQGGEGLEDLVGERRLPWADDPLAPLFLGDDVDRTSGAFMDTAAIMKNVDLVLSSDTAVAHLAGALGVPAWVALPFAADWRWFLNRSDSPWYPTMRLFRQKARGDWTSVFDEMRCALS